MNDKNDWEELIDRHLRGELEESEKERLAELLDTNAAARQEFVEQVQWDTEFAEAVRESNHLPRDAVILAAERAKTDGQWASKPTFLRFTLAAAAVVIVALSAGLIYQLAYPVDKTLLRRRKSCDVTCICQKQDRYEDLFLRLLVLFQ